MANERVVSRDTMFEVVRAHLMHSIGQEGKVKSQYDGVYVELPLGEGQSQFFFVKIDIVGWGVRCR